MTKLMPQDEDAPTQMPGSMEQQGTREQEPPGVDNIDFHHLALSKTEHRAWQREKSLRNLKINEESGGRVDRPSLKLKVICCSEPWREEHLHRDTKDEGMDRKLSSLESSLMCFLSGKDTLWCTRPHKKPTYLTVTPKSCPFF